MLLDAYSLAVGGLPFEEMGVYTHLKLNKKLHLLYKECKIKKSLIEPNSSDPLSISIPLVKKVFNGGLRVDLETKKVAVDELKKLLCLSANDDEAVSSFRAYDVKEVYFTQEISKFSYYPKCLMTTIRQFNPLYLSDKNSNKSVQLDILIETQAKVYISREDGSHTALLKTFVNKDILHPEKLARAFPSLKAEIADYKEPILIY